MKKEEEEKEIRVGICRHTNRRVLQIRDEDSDDAIDEKGWLCLHDETIEEEQSNILNFKYNLNVNIYSN